MWHHDLRYGTMCNLRYVDKVADKAAVCHLILNSSWGLLVQHSLKRKSSLGTTLAMNEMHIKVKHIVESDKNHPFLEIIWKWGFLDKYMRVEHLFDIYAKLYMPTQQLEFYVSFSFMFCSFVRCHGV